MTSESVARGHPDKLADQISDSILDACLAQDAKARVACDCLVKDKHVFLAGEIGASVFGHKDINYHDCVQKTLDSIGYSPDVFGGGSQALTHAGIVSTDFALHDHLGQQSMDINQGVDRADGEIGAGDQGMMYGYACSETPTLMPAPIYYCQEMMKLYDGLVHDKNSLRPDGKCQLTIRYDNGQPLEIVNVAVSAHHAALASKADLADLQKLIVDQVILPVLPQNMIDPELEKILQNIDLGQRLFINPTGNFVTGGPKGDAGLTGRKIIVDTYGGFAHHGGGAFSGKDPSKVDRSGAYIARNIAKTIVAAKIYRRCEIMLSYVIGIKDPVALHINSFGEKPETMTEIESLIRQHFQLTPKKIIEYLDLGKPIYSQTAQFGHFGKPEFSWEKTDQATHLIQT